MNKLMKQNHRIIKGIVLLIASVWLFSGHIYAQEFSEEGFCLLLSELSKEGNIFEVKKDGTGDFTSIVEGVQSVNSNDTLVIFSGIYEENVDIQNKTVNLIGIDRNSCVIMADSMSYHKIPLNFGAGRIQNLTIYGIKTKDTGGVMMTSEIFTEGDIDSIYAWQQKFPGYAIHIDQDYSYGKDVYIENCRIYSNNNQCIGIGCRAQNNISIVNCELVSNGAGGCIFFHNSANGMFEGKATFLMKGCELKNYSCPYVMAIHSMGDINPVEMTFQNNRICTIAYERKGRYNSNDDGTWPDVVCLQNNDLLNELNCAGYRSSYEGKLVNILSMEESIRFVRDTSDSISFLNRIPSIPEGITYIRMFEKSDYYVNEERTPKVRARTRHTIQMYNAFSCEKKDGWGGLSSIYLTNQSFGNTLIEMNYPTIAGVYY